MKTHLAWPHRQTKCVQKIHAHSPAHSPKCSTTGPHLIQALTRLFLFGKAKPSAPSSRSWITSMPHHMSKNGSSLLHRRHTLPAPQSSSLVMFQPTSPRFRTSPCLALSRSFRVPRCLAPADELNLAKRLRHCNRFFCLGLHFSYKCLFSNETFLHFFVCLGFCGMVFLIRSTRC